MGYIPGYIVRLSPGLLPGTFFKNTPFVSYTKKIKAEEVWGANAYRRIFITQIHVGNGQFGGVDAGGQPHIASENNDLGGAGSKEH